MNLPAMPLLARTALLTVLVMSGSLHAVMVQAQSTSVLPVPSASAARPEPGRPAGAPTMDSHRQQDVARHHTIAAAHETAARCLEGGERESVCQERLRKACEGIAIGRYCGMKHGH